MALRARVKKEWVDGSVLSYGRRVDAGTQGSVTFVYEVDGRSYRFLGVERIKPGTGDVSADIAPSKQNQGFRAVSRAVWVRIYKANKKFRDSFQ